jgi:hypothetical protein
MATVGMSLKDKVLETVRFAAMRPTDLVKALEKEAYAKEIEVALSALLDDGSVQFEYDGHLRPTAV